MNGASTIRACLTTTTGFAAVLRAAVGASRSSERSSSLWPWLPLWLRRLVSLLRRRRAADRSVAVIVVPRFAPSAYADRGAVGLLVPGAGSTVSRERALASLVRGRVVSSLVDLDGTPAIQLADRPATTTIYVSLPPPGSHHNVTRYPVAIVGPGYRGVLTSGSTRIDGLVSLADIAPTANAIAAGETPPIRSRADRDAAAALARLDVRLTRAHDARTGATLVLVGWLVAFAALGILARRSLAGRAAVLVAPVALATALLLRAVGIDQPSTVIAILAVVTGLGSLLLALRPALLVPAVVGFLVAFLVVLAAWPEVNALAAIGPHPGRRWPVLRRHERGRDAPARAVTCRSGGSRRHRRHGDRAPAPRSRRLEPCRGRRGRTAGRHGVRSPSCSPGSPACG